MDFGVMGNHFDALEEILNEYSIMAPSLYKRMVELGITDGLRTAANICDDPLYKFCPNQAREMANRG